MRKHFYGIFLLSLCLTGCQASDSTDFNSSLPTVSETSTVADTEDTTTENTEVVETDSTEVTTATDNGTGTEITTDNEDNESISFRIDGYDYTVEAFDGTTPYVDIDGSHLINKDDLNNGYVSMEYYSPLDELGRCGECVAIIGTDIQPTEERGEIGNVRPSGWDYNGHSNNNKYNGLVDGNYIYNRCHLIGYQLTGENDNPKNLVTGTRYLNIDGMLWLENMCDDYFEDSANKNNHIYYRVIPIFKDDELVCRGLVIRAYSLEDSGKAIDESIFAYNNQPQITINYLTGENWLSSETPVTETTPATTADTSEYITVVLNTDSLKYHKPDCKWAEKISEENREDYTGTEEELIREGYSACGVCFK